MNSYENLFKRFCINEDSSFTLNYQGNKVKLFEDHVFKTFSSPERMRRYVTAFNTFKDTTIYLPRIQYLNKATNTIIESFIPGIVLDEKKLHLSKNHLINLGILLGTFHSSCDFEEDAEEEWVSHIMANVDVFRSTLDCSNPDLNNSISFIEDESTILFEDLHFCITHGNFRPSNIILNLNDKNYYLIGLEDFGKCDPFWDIFTMLSSLKFSLGYNFSDIEAFLDGYKAAYILPDNLPDKWTFYSVYNALVQIHASKNAKLQTSFDYENLAASNRIICDSDSDSLIMANWLEEIESSSNIS